MPSTSGSNSLANPGRICRNQSNHRARRLIFFEIPNLLSQEAKRLVFVLASETCQGCRAAHRRRSLGGPDRSNVSYEGPLSEKREGTEANRLPRCQGAHEDR